MTYVLQEDQVSDRLLDTFKLDNGRVVGIVVSGDLITV
jgi:hypothetical protein